MDNTIMWISLFFIISAWSTVFAIIEYQKAKKELKEAEKTINILLKEIKNLKENLR